MTNYGEAARQAAKRRDFINIVLPFLIRNGWNADYAQSLFGKGLIRVRPGRDYKEFTLFLTSPEGCPRSIVDDLIHTRWRGNFTENSQVVTCFINEHTKTVASLAVTNLHTLADAFARCGHKPINNRFGQTFITLPFSHWSLSKDIKGYALKIGN